jgi:hypothetical protein
MPSVADQLRRDTVARVLALPLSDRIALALALGDEDADRYMRATGVSREEAIRRLSARHREGRTPSRAAAPPP